MKQIKKMMALVIAMVMVLSMSMAAFAADGDGTGEGEGDTPATVAYDHPLKVTGLAKDDVAHFYKVVEWVGEATGNVKGWKAVSPFDTILTTEKLTEVLIGSKTATAEDVAAGKAAKVGDLYDPTGITSELAGQLARAASGEGTAVTVTGTEAELDNPSAGMYMALITPKDIDTVYNPVFVSADYKKPDGSTIAVSESASYSDEAAAKKSTTELTKTASTTEADPDDVKWTTTAIGDTVSFTVTTTIPGFGEVYENPYFKLTDKLYDLTLVANSVKITSPTIPDGKATITEGTDNYSILFDSEWLKTITTPTTVTITYNALVATTAPLNVNREKNEVSTEFSHNPNDESDHAFKKDTTQHYTFTLDAEGMGEGENEKGKKTSELVKVGQDENGNPITSVTKNSYITEANTWTSPLAGAKFKLYRDANCTQEYVPKNADGTDGSPLVIETKEDGRMTISGLDAGKYWLQESEAPAGYVKDTSKIPIVITAVTSEKTITEYSANGTDWISQEEYDKLAENTKKTYKPYTYKTETLDSYTVQINGENTATYHFKNKGNEAEIDWTEEPPVELPFDIINTKGLELPSTGGIGTTLFYIIGAILVLGAGILLVTRRRMNVQ